MTLPVHFLRLDTPAAPTALDAIDETLLAAVSDIESSTETDGHRFAWGGTAIRDTLATPGSGLALAVETELATAAQRPLAFCLYRTVCDELEILQVATHRLAQRRGIASALLRYVLGEARRQAVTSGFLEVRESNQPARRLYESLGFVEAGRRRGYYSEPSEDALLLKLTLDAAA